MEFRYINFSENIFKTVMKEYQGKEDTLFVYRDDMDRYSSQKYFSEFLQFSGCTQITVAEFKENCFFSEKPLLREEKRVIGFYKSLDVKSRDFFGIKEYFDSIDIASNFFEFYSDLNESCISNVNDKIKLKKHQKEIYKHFENIYKNYSIFLEEKGFCDAITIYKSENITIESFNNIKNIVFINPPSLSKLMREIINKLSNKKNIMIYILGNEKVFGKELISFDFDIENLHNKLYFSSFSDTFEQLAAAIIKTKKYNNAIIVDLDNNSIAKKIISGTQISSNNKVKFTETALFKFIASLYELVQTREYAFGKKVIKSSTLLSAMLIPQFRDYFRIGVKEKNEILSYIKDGNCYLDSSHEAVFRICSELDKIEKANSITDIAEYLKSIDLSKFSEEQFLGIDDIYYSSIYEMSSIDELKMIDNSEKELFFKNKVGENLLRIAMKFLRYDEIVLNKKTDKEISAIYKDFDKTPLSYKEDSMAVFINLIEGVMPPKKNSSFFFSEQQKKECGIIGYEEERADIKRKFVEKVNSFETVYLFSIQNEEKNIETSSFYEEFVAAGANKNEEDDNKKIKNKIISIYSQGNKLFEKQVNDESEKIFREKDSEFYMGYYDYSIYKQCNAKYYFMKKNGLYKEYPEINRSIDLRILGIIVHDIFRVCAEKIEKARSVDVINIEKIEKDIRDNFNMNLLKFPIPFKNYYIEIMAPFIAKSVVKFFTENSEIIEFGKFEAEKKYKMELQEKKVTFSAKPDLFLEKNGEIFLVEYKTGNGNKEQLDFYGSIIYEELKKDIDNTGYGLMYNVFKMELKKEILNLIQLSLMKDEALMMISEVEYARAAKKSTCKVCEYIDICRPEGES